MAIYRLAASIIGRAAGNTIVGVAARRGGQRLVDRRLDVVHNHARRRGVIFRTVALPPGAPHWAHEREDLWNEVEAVEKRVDAQLAREVQLSLPHEVDAQQRIQLVMDFVNQAFVRLGMAADVSIHTPHNRADPRHHFAIVLLTMRELTAAGFGPKIRDWNRRALLESWRATWETLVNQALQRADVPTRVDRRSLEVRGIDREPEPRLGPVATDMERRGIRTYAGRACQRARRRNRIRAAYGQRLANARQAATAQKSVLVVHKPLSAERTTHAKRTGAQTIDV